MPFFSWVNLNSLQCSANMYDGHCSLLFPKYALAIKWSGPRTAPPRPAAGSTSAKGRTWPRFLYDLAIKRSGPDLWGRR